MVVDGIVVVDSPSSSVLVTGGRGASCVEEGMSGNLVVMINGRVKV